MYWDSLVSLEMECLICFDDLNNRENESIISCRSHQFHTECAYLWFRNSKAQAGNWGKCPICCSNISESEMLEVLNYSEKYAEKVLKITGVDDLVRLRVYFEEGHKIQVEFFVKMVIKALRSEAGNCLFYLKTMEEKYLRIEKREALAVEIYRLRYPLSISWISGNFDVRFEISKHDRIGMIQYLVNNGSFLQLYWIFKANFGSFTHVERVAISQLLYDGLEARLWHWKEVEDLRVDGASTGWSMIFDDLADANQDMGCYIMGELCPIVTNGANLDLESFYESEYDLTLRSCVQCNRSHFLDSLKLAIEQDNEPFITALSGYMEEISEQSKKDIVVMLIRSTSKPEELMHILVEGTWPEQREQFKYLFYWLREKDKLYGLDKELTYLEKRKIDKQTRIALNSY